MGWDGREPGKEAAAGCLWQDRRYITPLYKDTIEAF